ncbi:hypothetical protein MMC25_004642 [Agyrium rufum]|nr:hypothetical protein [Agyrium rufum]
MDENVLRAASLLPHTVQGFKATTARCKSVLEELQGLINKYGNGKLRTYQKFKWQLEDIKGLQSKLKAGLNGLDTFNSAVALSLSFNLNFEQQRIVKKLNKVQFDVQVGRREGSVVSRANADAVLRGDEDLLSGVLEDLRNEGIPQAAIGENKPFITRWVAKGAKAGEWEEQPPDTAPLDFQPNVSALDSEPERKWEILSAAYGPSNVTSKMRTFITTHVSARTKTRTFTPSDTFFGHDPKRGPKSFVMVWRTQTRDTDDGSWILSKPSTLAVRQNELVTFDYTMRLPPQDMDGAIDGSLIVLNASWFTVDVTATIVRISGDPFRVSNTMFGNDPFRGHWKSLVITYTYKAPFQATDCLMKVAIEDEEVYIPPPLIIHAAFYHKADVTEMIRASVDPEQVLILDCNKHFCVPDPAYGVVKTIAILYQYGSNLPELYVGHEGGGWKTLRPTGEPIRRSFFNQVPQRSNDVYIMAAIWGIQPIDLKHFGLMSQSKQFRISNEWFGFDGFMNVQKTCHVFVQFPSTGEIKCIVGAEGETMEIPPDPSIAIAPSQTANVSEYESSDFSGEMVESEGVEIME